MHTKGPWKAESVKSDGTLVYKRIKAANGKSVAFAGVYKGHDEEANALLIAAAPELYQEFIVSIERGFALGYSCEDQLELYKNITGEEYVEEYHRRKAKGE